MMLYTSEAILLSVLRRKPYSRRWKELGNRALATLKGIFEHRKKLLGYCHATNMMAGELYEEKGRWQQAETEYREIVEREPDNPWGWLLLGGLYGSVEEAERACAAFDRALKLVPAHAPAYSAIGQLMMLRG